MKKMLSILCVAALVSMSSAALALGPATGGEGTNIPGSGLYGSIHDLTTNGTPVGVPGFRSDTLQQRLCVYCHTPHHAHYPGDPSLTGAAANAEYLPLWSHDVSTVSYTPYASATFDPKGGTTMGSTFSGDILAGPSRLCMSCHDGVTAVDNYYGKTGGTAMGNNAGTSFESMPVIDANGQTNHPIGFNMIDVIPGQGGAHIDNNSMLTLDNTSTYVTGFAGATTTIFSRLYRDVNGAQTIMTCSTCHDVHNNLNKVSYITGVPNFLTLGTQKLSGLCNSCHTQAGGDAFMGRTHTSVPLAVSHY